MAKIKHQVKTLDFRKISGCLLGILGLLIYNWWIIVPFKPGLLTSPNQLFSDLEIDSRPYAAVMQHADLISGILLLAAFLIIGNKRLRATLHEWLALVVFSIGALLGGIFVESCSDTTSAVCRHLEVTLQLPAHHYLHMIFGVIEFAAITIALFLAYFRTKTHKTLVARTYKILARGSIVAYPLLIIAYLTNRLGAVIEPVFFLAFAIIVVMQIYERTSAHPKV